MNVTICPKHGVWHYRCAECEGTFNSMNGESTPKQCPYCGNKAISNYVHDNDRDYRDITEPPDVEGAIDIAGMYGMDDGSHHKQWVIDQMLRRLLGHRYSLWVEEYEEDDYF